MIITLVTKKRINSLVLPEKPSGKYWMTSGDDTEQLIAIEGLVGSWGIRSNSTIQVLGADRKEVDAVTLDSQLQVIPLAYRNTGETARMIAEPNTVGGQTFSKFVVSKNMRLNIGRGSDNEIVIENKYVSTHHACLEWDGKTWTVTDLQSGNGTFVNEQRIATTPLNWGDCIYIMGIKLVVCNSFFAINNPNDCVFIQGNGIAKLKTQSIDGNAYKSKNKIEMDSFYRAPRFFRQISSWDFRIDPPPSAQKHEPLPFMLLLGPALTMGMTSVVMASIAGYGLYMGTNSIQSALPTFAMCFSMLSATMLWAPLTRKNEKKLKEKAEYIRKNTYQNYLDRVQGQIHEQCSLQSEILLENSPSLQVCNKRIIQIQDGLWERNPSHSDFLSLRLGLGDITLLAEIKYPESRFSVDDDYLFNDMKRLEIEPKLLKNIPITASLVTHPITGVLGDIETRISFLNGLILQITSLHSWDEVKLIVIINDKMIKEQEFLRWLPHTWSDNQQMHYIVTCESDGKIVGSEIEKMIASRKEISRIGKGDKLPHYVAVAYDMDLAEKIEFFRDMSENTEELGISVLCIAETVKELPKDCMQVIHLESGKSSRYHCEDTTGEKDYFVAEYPTGIDLLETGLSLANLPKQDEASRYSLPSKVTFLDLYGVGKVEHLNARSRWIASNPVHTLQAQVGIGRSGEGFFLDLHEKYHGPHGLVAGMTGSGKSEFIITYILSMAINYHPDEVSFILIDYKGGGLAGAFENELTGVSLPHLAGTITNLDGASIKRSLISIQSELIRRQNVFNQAKKMTGEGTIDIYKYQTMYRSGQVSEPVPHLIIVSDEFAELKTQQPEFMEKLISAARIGRSLGVHLILATQKPAGVVNDQIWSNSRFRVCLKVQERADSMDMLKRPEAAEISEAGRFYLQVGYNEIFDQGQSAWCGAPYAPVDDVNDTTEVFAAIQNGQGQVLAEVRPEPTGVVIANTSQTVSVVDYLYGIAKEENIQAQKLWLPIIPKLILLENLKKKYVWTPPTLCIEGVVGEYDNPFNQTQNLLTVPFTEEGNAIVYGTVGSGKNMLLDSLICGLLEDYSADLLNLYILDLGEETLTAYEGAPQVGDVILGSRPDKVVNLFKMLRKESYKRKKLFAQGGGSYLNYYQQERETILPQIVVVIRNFFGFTEQFEALDDAFIKLSKESSKYGIYFLITGTGESEIRPRYSRSFPQIISLQLHEKSDYASLLGNTQGVYPSEIKGRGLIKKDRIYEFQTSQFYEDDSYESIVKYWKEKGKKGKVKAKPVPSLPDKVTTDTFVDSLSLEKFPVGVENESLRFATIDMTKAVVYLILAQTASLTVGTTSAIISQLCASSGETVIFWDGNKSFSSIKGVVQYTEKFDTQVNLLFDEAVRRNNTYKTALNEGKELPVFEPLTYGISGLSSILKSISAESKERLEALLDKIDTNCKVRIIICDGVDSMVEYSNSPWFKTQTAGSGLWIGEGLTEQRILKSNVSYSRNQATLTKFFGYLVSDGQAALIKVLTLDSEYKEEEDDD